MSGIFTKHPHTSACGLLRLRVSGGAETIGQFIEACLIDEFTRYIAPLLPGTGIRLPDHIDQVTLRLEQAGVGSSLLVTHINYRVAR
jgi:riboflavin biosynthesis pyrimidine reductase